MIFELKHSLTDGGARFFMKISEMNFIFQCSFDNKLIENTRQSMKKKM